MNRILGQQQLRSYHRKTYLEYLISKVDITLHIFFASLSFMFRSTMLSEDNAIESKIQMNNVAQSNMVTYFVMQVIVFLIRVGGGSIALL